MESARVPQHLELEDVVTWGLSAADLICVVAGAVVGWWSYLALPDPLVGRVALSVLIVLLGAALGIVRIGQLPLRGWIAVVSGYAVRSRLLITTGRR